MWLGSGKHSVKEGMIEINQERIAIIQSLLGIVNGLEVENTQSKKGLWRLIGNPLLLFVYWEWEIWPGSGKNTVK